LRFSGHLLKGLALASIVAMVAVACSEAAGGNAGEQTIAIASPADGATVSMPFEVQLDSSVPIGKPDTGNHHVHLYFDTDRSAADYDIVYSTTWQVTRDLAPGEHTIIAVLANPDHSLAGPTQTIHVTVSGSGGGGGGAGGAAAPSAAPSAAPTQDTGGYPY
jgi:hypothetical protein